MTVHTINVPPGWSPEQAWEHISRGHRLPEIEGEWVSLEIDGGAPDAQGFWRDGRLVRVVA